MIHYFDRAARSIVIPVNVSGPIYQHDFRFVLDIGATMTCIRPDFLRLLGYDMSRPFGRRRIRSATGSVIAPLFRVSTLISLGQRRSDFLIAAQEMPITVEADGLLGLDFFRGLVLTLDFARGQVNLCEPHSWWQLWR